MCLPDWLWSSRVQLLIGCGEDAHQSDHRASSAFFLVLQTDNHWLIALLARPSWSPCVHDLPWGSQTGLPECGAPGLRT
jgi:hypothetical protein